MNKRNRQAAGFTLIELMVVIVLVAVLTLVAVPSYEKYIERGDLAHAEAELLRLNALLKTERLREPGELNNEASLKSAFNVLKQDNKVAQKYELSVVMPDSGSNAYYLLAVPDYYNLTKAVWVDSIGRAYICENATDAKLFSSAKCQAAN